MNRKQANLEEEHLLQGATSWQGRLPEAAQSLSRSLQGYMENRKVFFRKACELVDAWQAVLPPPLTNICRLKEYKTGTLYVEVTPGPYLQQMHMIQHELLKELQRRCPRSGLRKITIVPLKADQESDESYGR